MKNPDSAAPMTVSETQKMAQNMAKMLVERAHAGGTAPGATVLSLHGDLGAGKTTFVQFLGQELGVQESMQSPTFVIEKIYKLEGSASVPEISKYFDHFIHIDAYRIENPEEMRTLGWDTIIANPRNIIAVEWPERLGSLIPGSSLRLSFSHHDEMHRIITLQ